MMDLPDNITSTSERTSQELESILSDLSEASFKNRTPVVVYLSMVSIVGFVGNTLVLLVYGLRFKPNATRVFVFFMASLDLVANLVALPLQLYTIRYAYNIDMASCRSMLAFSTLSTQASGFVLVLVSVDRFWRICFPFRPQLDSREAVRVACVVVGIVLVVFACFVPYYGTHQISIASSDIQVRMCWSKDSYKGTIYPIAYKVTVGIAFFLGIAITLSAYISIGIRLWRRSKEKQDTLKQASKIPKSSENRDTSEVSVQERVLSPESGTVSDIQSDQNKNVDDETFRDQPQTETPQRPCEDIQCQPGAQGISDQTKPAEDPNQAQRRCIRATRKPAGKYVLQMRSHTTLMMCVLAVFYLLNWLPHLIMRAIHDDPVNLCDNFTDCGYNTYAIALRSYYLNSAVNAFVYSFCNQRFRHECRQLFRGIWKRMCTRDRHARNGLPLDTARQRCSRLQREDC